MRKLLYLAVTLWAGGLAMLAGPSLAQQGNPVVVELFTSQGCSSCPPADALLAQLGGRDDVIPLALHVDYWDYIGWKDSFAQPGFTKRQKGYAHAGGWRQIYTPQMVINGSDDVVGSRPMKVAELIQRHAMKPAKARISLERRGGMLHIRAEALVPGKPCDIHIIRYEPSHDTTIVRGENAGKTLTYTHIARRWDGAGQWNGRGVFEASVPVQGNDPVVVLVQERGYGPIVAAARLR